jgi:hypothetical protein
MKVREVTKRETIRTFFYDYICTMILNQQGSESNGTGNSAQATQMNGAERHGAVTSRCRSASSSTTRLGTRAGS